MSFASIVVALSRTFGNKGDEPAYTIFVVYTRGTLRGAATKDICSWFVNRPECSAIIWSLEQVHAGCPLASVCEVLDLGRISRNQDKVCAVLTLCRRFFALCAAA